VHLGFHANGLKPGAMSERSRRARLHKQRPRRVTPDRASPPQNVAVNESKPRASARCSQQSPRQNCHAAVPLRCKWGRLPPETPRVVDRNRPRLCAVSPQSHVPRSAQDPFRFQQPTIATLALLIGEKSPSWHTHISSNRPDCATMRLAPPVRDLLPPQTNDTMLQPTARRANRFSCEAECPLFQ
jgi:hypothetical protein